MRKTLSTMAIAAAALAGFSAPSHAYIVMTLTDNTGAVTKSCSNQNAGTLALCSSEFLTVAGGNLMIFGGVVGGFNVSTTSATANVPGSAIEAFIDQSATRVSSNLGIAAQFTIDVKAFDFTSPLGAPAYLSGSASYSTTPSSGGTIFSEFYVDPTNGGGTSVATPGCVMSIVLNNGSCDGGTASFANPGPKFSLFERQIFNLNARQDINTTQNVTVHVPEPVSTSLVGLGLLGLALTSRRRAAKKA